MGISIATSLNSIARGVEGPKKEPKQAGGNMWTVGLKWQIQVPFKRIIISQLPSGACRKVGLLLAYLCYFKRLPETPFLCDIPEILLYLQTVQSPGAYYKFIVQISFESEVVDPLFKKYLLMLV